MKQREDAREVKLKATGAAPPAPASAPAPAAVAIGAPDAGVTAAPAAPEAPAAPVPAVAPEPTFEDAWANDLPAPDAQPIPFVSSQG